MGQRRGQTKTAVDKVGIAKKRDVNARVTAMHCPLSHMVCICCQEEPAMMPSIPSSAIRPQDGAGHWFKPNGGGQVEKNVRDARRRATGVVSARPMWQLMPAFPDLDARNIRSEDRSKLLWTETAHGRLPESIAPFCGNTRTFPRITGKDAAPLQRGPRPSRGCKHTLPGSQNILEVSRVGKRSGGSFSRRTLRSSG